MTSDIILSSQLGENDSFNSSSVYSYFSATTQEESLSLNLTEEESDWEFISTPSSSKRKIESTSETSLSDSTSVGSQDLFEKCSLEMFKVQKLADDASDSIPNVVSESKNSQNVASAVNDNESLSITCHTACSQDIHLPHSLTCSSSASFLDSSFDVFDAKTFLQANSEVKASVEKTGHNQLQTLDFDRNQTALYNLIACVTICYPVREIWCTSKKCWQTMGAILLSDHTNKYIKLILWGKQCYNALSQCSGNVIYINRAQVKSTSVETVLGLASESKLITLCSALSVTTLRINESRVEGQLMNVTQMNLNWFTTHHSVLCKRPIKDILPLSSGEVQFCDLPNLECGKVVHIAVRIASVVLKYRTKRNSTPCVVCVFSDSKPDLCMNLYLNGSARQWIPMFRKYYDRRWEIRYVASCLSRHDSIELHTTVFSIAECNFDNKLLTLNTRLTKRVPNVVSYDQLISQVHNQKSTQVTLCNISICSICVSSLHFQVIIDRSTSTILRLKEKFAAFLNKSNSRTLLYALNCCYKVSNEVFTVWSSYEDFLALLKISSLKSLHYQAVDRLFQSIDEVLHSKHKLLVDLNISNNDVGLLENVRINLKATVR